LGNLFIFWCRNAYFRALSGPFEYLILHRNPSRFGPPVRLPSLTFQLTVARSKALEFLQKRVLNITFPGSEYVTNLIIANVETLRHDDSYSYSFLARDSIYAIARYMPSPVRLSVCPSLCPSHGWISQRRFMIGSRNLHHRVAP